MPCKYNSEQVEYLIDQFDSGIKHPEELATLFSKKYGDTKVSAIKYLLKKEKRNYVVADDSNRNSSSFQRRLMGDYESVGGSVVKFAKLRGMKIKRAVKLFRRNNLEVDEEEVDLYKSGELEKTARKKAEEDSGVDGLITTRNWKIAAGAFSKRRFAIFTSGFSG